MTNALLVWPLHSYLTLVTWDRNMRTYRYVSDTERVKEYRCVCCPYEIEVCFSHLTILVFFFISCSLLPV